MNRRMLLILAALPLTAVAGESTRGDALTIEEAPLETRQPATTPREVPVRGMDMANVRHIFGEPQREHAPVGEPPITRWDYAGFSVFFEHDKVLHAVITP